MRTKKVGIILSCIIGGILGVFLLHQGLNILGSSQPSHAQNQTTKACPEQMVWIPGGKFRMGSDTHYEEEKSVGDVRVEGFCMDQYEVTNAQFAQFVAETSYVTVAEQPLSAEEFPELTEEQRAPGSLVFIQPDQGQPVRELSWWHWIQGADWQHPQGKDSTIEGKDNYPVVQISYEDAQAYAQWAGKSLPTEAQWEFAARGGLRNKEFTWGNKYSARKANTWQGKFPVENTNKDGYLDTAPVGSFPANNYELYDMAGNVWEWTQDWYRPGHEGKSHQVNPTMSDPEESYDPSNPGVPQHVTKGGSYLCARNYCSRFRPAAREAQAPDTGTTHIGFRLVSPVASDNT